MKRFIPAIMLGAMMLNAAPASAQEGPDYDTARFELTYSPLRASSSKPEGVVQSNMQSVTLSGEGRVCRGIIVGGSYTWGSGDKYNLSGCNEYGEPLKVTFSDANFQDLKVYCKIPFNFENFTEDSRTVGPEPAMSPFYGYIGYKNTNMTAKNPSTNPSLGKLSAESSSGFGIGLGADVKFDPIALYGQIVYYPCMLTKNVGIVTEGGSNSSHLNVWEYDIGLRSNFKDSPVQAKVGYHFEQHRASNINLQYDGIVVGITGEF